MESNADCYKRLSEEIPDYIDIAIKARRVLGEHSFTGWTAAAAMLIGDKAKQDIYIGAMRHISDTANVLSKGKD